MSKEIKEGIKEGIKEVLRTAVIAVIPIIISQLQTNQVDWRAMAIAGAIALLSGVDKWLHKEEKGVMGNGLTGF